MISHKLKIIFIHIPKCAGKAITNYYKALIHHSKRKYGTHDLPTSDAYKDYWNEYFTFTFVRNPWSRLVSSFFYNKKLQKKNQSVYGWKKEKPALINYIISCNTFEQFIDGITQDMLFSRKSYHPQIEWIKDWKYDYIGKVEKLGTDLLSINKLINYYPKNAGKIPHKNKSKHEHYTTYYNKKTIEKVYKFYKEDIKKFKYEFGE